MTQQNRIDILKGFILGGVCAIIVVLGVGKLNFFPTESAANRVLAQIGNERFTEADARKTFPQYWIPLESDYYQISKSLVDQWVEKKLLEKEAKAKSKSVEDLVYDEIWKDIEVENKTVANFFEKNKQWLALPADQAKGQVKKLLRQTQYEAQKMAYLEKLKGKYKVKILVERPERFIEGAVMHLGDMPDKLPAEGQLKMQAKRPTDAPTPAPKAPAPAADMDYKNQPAQGPANAPVTLIEASDFHCPFCGRASPTIDQLMKNYQGKIRRVWLHFPLTMHRGADRTHEASECAHEQGKFWEYKSKLFSQTGKFKTDEALIQAAGETGLDAKKFEACLKSDRYKAKVQQNIEQGKKLGVRGTPNFFVNGQKISGARPYQDFDNAVKNALNPGSAPTPAQPPKPTPPAKVEFKDLKGRPSLGPENAPVTIVEFSDFHCPFCSRVGPSLEKVMENYKGKVRRVFRHFPLSMHKGADRTAEASECAHEQGKFWEYKKKLFENVGKFRTDEALVNLANDVGLNKKKFSKCLESGKYKETVQKDMAKGRESGVRGTPASFVNGKLVSGAKPYESFAAIVDEAIKSK